MPEPSCQIRLFDKALHDRRAFSCGVAQIDSWLKSSISDLIRENRVRVWCATGADGKLVGFYSLCAHQVEPEAAPVLAGRRRMAIPTVYLTALAVDRACQGQGIGGALMAHAIEKAIEVSDQIGAAALVLDVLRDEQFKRRKAFYLTLGFAETEPGGDRLYLTMNDARTALLAAT